MKTKLLPMRLVTQGLVLAGLVSATGLAVGHDVYLCAKTLSKPVPGGTVPMWGFAPDNSAGDCANPATVPGPAITVPAGDSTLNVYVKNTLATPVSFVINGQAMPAATGAEPVWTDNSTGPRGASLTKRVRSFVHETAPTTTGNYTFNGVRPGTYLYQSGTHPQVQVQMGLYGAMTRNAVDVGTPEAYAGVPYGNQVTLLYSEIDPALHEAVNLGTYDPDTNSTLNYAPKYFLINGSAFEAPGASLANLTAGQDTLLRFLNAGLQTHVPVIGGATLRMIAEDGNPYPWPANPREQYSVLLPAAKTIDAMLTPQAGPGGAANRYPVYDRRLSLTNGAAQDGGMLAYLDVGAGGIAPAISSTAVTVATQDSPYSYTVSATDVDGGSLNYSLDIYPVGMTINSSTGAIAWTPSAQQVGSQPVTARVTDPTGLFATQSFNVAVANVNDRPVAQDDFYTAIRNGTLNVAAPGILANDSDPDAGDTLTAVSFSAVVGGGTNVLNANGDGSFSFSATAVGNKTFTYRASDNHGVNSLVARVTINVINNRAPIANEDTFSVPVRKTAPAYVPQALSVLANDVDPDTVIDPTNVINPATVVITVAPNKGGAVTVNPDGTITYTPKLNFRGTEAFKYRVRDNQNSLSNASTVRVHVQ